MCRVRGTAPSEARGSTSSNVGTVMSYFARACPDCAELFIWDDLGRFHEATGDERCESLQVRLAGEVEEVRDAASLRGRHGEFEKVPAVGPHHLP